MKTEHTKKTLDQLNGMKDANKEFVSHAKRLHAAGHMSDNSLKIIKEAAAKDLAAIELEILELDE